MLDESIFILGASGLFCRFYYIFDGKSCEQTMKTLIRRHIVASDLGLHCLPTSFSMFPDKNGLMVNREQPYHSLNFLYFL